MSILLKEVIDMAFKLNINAKMIISTAVFKAFLLLPLLLK